MSSNEWNADLYDGKHSFVSQYGSDLIKLLAPREEERILDLGCGTGDIAKSLYDAGVFVEGIDKSESMINQAKSKYPTIPFVIGDATDLTYHEKFDAVFSNAALHWVKPPEKALTCIHNSLQKGGRFVAEFGGKGNVQIITSEIERQFHQLGLTYTEKQFPWYFPSIGEYTTLMEKVGFRVTFASHFDRPTPLDGENGLRNWIEMFGQTMFQGLDVPTTETLITRVEDSLKPVLCDGGNWIADYKRIQVIGLKE